MAYSQNMPSMRRATVRCPCTASTAFGDTLIGSTLTTDASYPADSITSCAAAISSLLSTAADADFPMRLTETSETPSWSESSWVMVEMHAAQVIPPTENVTRRGPFISTTVVSRRYCISFVSYGFYSLENIPRDNFVTRIGSGRVVVEKRDRHDTDGRWSGEGLTCRGCTLLCV